MFIDNSPAPQEKTLVLMSGGLDSAVALAIAKANTCEQVYTCSFSYGQKHKKELASAAQLSTHYGTKHKVFNLGTCLQQTSGPEHNLAELQKHRHTLGMLPPSWKPARNIVFMAVAAGYAWWADINLMVLGVHQEDYPGYPDCREMYLRYMESAMTEGTAFPIDVWVPLLNMNKALIVQIGRKLNVPFKLTWSCYEGGEKPCRTCDACQRREAAFELNQMVDPLLKEKKNGH